MFTHYVYSMVRVMITFLLFLGWLEEIKQKAIDSNEFEITKTTHLTNKDKSIVYCEVHKKVYIANKPFFKEKRSKKKN